MGQHEIVAEKTRGATPESGRGVEVTIQVDSFRKRRADGLADF
jgi:hypothetical protein